MLPCYTYLYSDCIWGSFLSASIFFLFLGLSSLLDYMHPNLVDNFQREDHLDFAQLVNQARPHPRRPQPAAPPVHQREERREEREEPNEEPEIDTDTDTEQRDYNGRIDEEGDDANSNGGMSSAWREGMYRLTEEREEWDDSGAGPAPLDHAAPAERLQEEVQQQQENEEDDRDNGAGELAAADAFNDDADDDDGQHEGIEFDELVGLKGPLSALAQKVVYVIAFNGAVLAVFLLFPFLIGRFVVQLWALGLEGLNRSYFDSFEGIQNLFTILWTTRSVDNIPGFIFHNSDQDVHQLQGLAQIVDPSKGDDDKRMANNIVFTFIGYVVLFFSAMTWLLLSFIFKRRLNDVNEPLTKFVVASIHFTYTFFKVCTLSFIELGAFPQLCGWWLDYCTILLFDVTWQSRLAFFHTNPFTSLFLHWILGLMYMFYVASCVSWVRSMLRPEVLWFLRNPDDPNFNPIKEMIEYSLLRHIRRIIFAVSMYCGMVGLLVGLPILLCYYTVPSLFPFRVWSRDTYGDGPFDLLLLDLTIPLALEYIHPRDILKSLLGAWLRFIGNLLSLSSYLFPSHDPQTNQELPVAYPSSFGWRIAALLVLSWATLFIWNIAFFSVPLVIGRALLGLLPSPLNNDIYAVGVGFALFWGVIKVSDFLYRFVVAHTRNPMQLLRRIGVWAVIALKCAFLLTFWAGLIPLLVGTLFQFLLLVPLRVHFPETPVRSPLYHEWILGTFYLNLWCRLVMIGPPSTWKTKFDQILTDGFRNLRMIHVFKTVIWPITRNLLTLLAVPYVLSQGVIPYFITPFLFSSTSIISSTTASLFSFGIGAESEVLNGEEEERLRLHQAALFFNSVCYRLSFVAFLGCLLAWKALMALHRWFQALQRKIKDEKYLVGRHLLNYDEQQLQQLQQEEQLHYEQIEEEEEDEGEEEEVEAY
ncbi:E3 ubiquitin-protein ligase march6 [Balamuthia mandrillaris]